MSKKISLAFGILSLVLLLMTSGCGGSFENVQASQSGILLEQVFPKDTEVFMSFSTLNEDQREFFQAITERFSDDPGALKNKIIEGIDSRLQAIDLSYIEDLQPILGENGFRFAFGLKAGGGTDMLMSAALTLEDPEKARLLLGDLEASGRFVRTTRDGFDIYSRVLQANSLEGGEGAVTVPETTFYFMINEDLLLISSQEDELMNMSNLMRSEQAESLWTDATYQRFIADMVPQHVLLSYVNKNLFTQGMGQISSLATTGDAQIQDYLLAQGGVVVATKDGFQIHGIALGDEEKLKTDGVALSDLATNKSHKRYLDEVILGGPLVAYFESYDLASSLEAFQAISGTEASVTGEDSIGTMLSGIQALLGVSLEDLIGMTGEGYSVSFHRNAGFLPGITILIDVSEGTGTASSLVKSLNDYISALLGILRLQQGEFADAISSSEQTILGGEFYVAQADLDLLMALYNAGGSAFTLPEELQGLQLTLLFGLTTENQLMISMYEGWLNEEQSVLTEDAIYQKTTDELAKASEGMVYINFDEALSYAKEFKTFRDALRADAAALIENYSGALGNETETMTETSTTVVPEGGEVIESIEPVEVLPAPTVESLAIEAVDSKQWVDFLEPLKSFAFSGKTNDTTMEFNGVLLLDD